LPDAPAPVAPEPEAPLPLPAEPVPFEAPVPLLPGELDVPEALEHAKMTSGATAEPARTSGAAN